MNAPLTQADIDLLLDGPVSPLLAARRIAAYEAVARFWLTPEQHAQKEMAYDLDPQLLRSRLS